IILQLDKARRNGAVFYCLLRNFAASEKEAAPEVGGNCGLCAGAVLRHERRFFLRGDRAMPLFLLERRHFHGADSGRFDKRLPCFFLNIYCNFFLSFNGRKRKKKKPIKNGTCKSRTCKLTGLRRAGQESEKITFVKITLLWFSFR